MIHKSTRIWFHFTTRRWVALATIEATLQKIEKIPFLPQEFIVEQISISFSPQLNFQRDFFNYFNLSQKDQKENAFIISYWSINIKRFSLNLLEFSERVKFYWREVFSEIYCPFFIFFYCSVDWKQLSPIDNLTSDWRKLGRKLFWEGRRGFGWVRWNKKAQLNVFAEYCDDLAKKRLLRTLFILLKSLPVA
jgi:hypothetical protein